MIKRVALFLSALALSATSSAQSDSRPQILVLGTYHMANPGRDVFNMKADDVLAPKRQAEIAELIAALKKFQPTKIALEGNIFDDRLPKRYSDYLSGKYELTRNETDQIGLRLAKELDHKTVYPVDVDGDFPYPRVVNFAKATGRSKELEAMMSEIGSMVKAQDAYLASHTIFETLLYMNSDDKVAQDVGMYFRQAQFGQPGDWAGADLVSDWFRRNMRIYSNVVQLADSPHERVLVIFGAGHLGWLQHAFASNRNVRLRKLTEFARSD